ncbi:MAG: GWxTD domain-containing protein [Saprospiraceae bacterium]|nr:GWxTD domain-containing protein [Saprospiraceae bacterium]
MTTPMNNTLKLWFAIVFLSINSNLYGINVSVSPCVFQGQQGQYLEVYTRIIGESVQFQIDSVNQDVLQASIEMLVIISQNEEIVNASKYQINSPESKDIIDFWDLKRYTVTPGKIDLKIQFVDMNRISDTLNFETSLEVAEKSVFSHSNILFMAEINPNENVLAFNKNNFSFEPLCFNLASPEQNTLYIYTELYNTSALSDKPCFLKYHIEALDESVPFIPQPGYKRLKMEGNELLLLEFDIENMGSGNYILHCDLFDRDKVLLETYSSHFAVQHPIVDLKNNYEKDQMFETSFVQILDQDELDYGLKAIAPLIGNDLSETLNFVIGSDDLKAKKYFLYSFWLTMSKTNTRDMYKKYMDVAKAVDIQFANNVGHGFQTDRGFYFLKYGRPDDIVKVEEEPSAPPYEIWIYNYLPATQQTNVKFLFYNPSLAGNDYILLHSTCRGEINNPNWEFDLYRDAFDNFDDDSFNKNARRYFNDF